LITPFGELLDLQAIRAELAGTAPDTTTAAEVVDPMTTDAAPTTVAAIPTGSTGG
jgi:hypothetical protein